MVLEQIGVLNRRKRQQSLDDDLLLVNFVQSVPLTVRPVKLANAQSPRKKRAVSRNTLLEPDEIIENFYTNADFVGHFGIRRSTAEYIIHRFGEDILARRAPTGRPPSNVTYPVLLSLWTLTNQESFDAISKRFNVSKSQAHRMFTLFCDTVTNNLYEEIEFPSNEEEMESCVKSFQDCSFKTLPNTVGCLGSTFVPLRGLREDGKKPEGKKGFAAIILQCVCDANAQLLDMFVSWPSNASDQSHCVQTFYNSTLYERLSQNNQLGDCHLIANSKYPLEDFLMTPFNEQLIAKEQEKYNQVIHSTGMIIQNCFALLKSRFKRLEHLDTMKVDLAIKIISSACVLHNICVKSGEPCNTRATYKDPNPIENEIDCAHISQSGEFKRDRLIQFLSVPNE